MTRLKASKSGRQFGDPLSRAFVKETRLRHGLSQDQLAAKLGLRGGKSVVSGWETGRTRCEGPAAELLLMLFGAAPPDALTRLTEAADAIWKRAGNFEPTWRQLAIVPTTAASIDRDSFASLFPGVALPEDQHPQGFPPVHWGAPDLTYRLASENWTGVIPLEAERPPQLFWRLDRAGVFGYRRRIWEEDPMSVTGGQIHFGSQFNLVIPALFFYGRLAQRCGLDPALSCRLQLDLEGIANRGVVAYQTGRALDDFALDEARGASARNHVTATVQVRLQEIISNPRETALSLIGEMALIVRPDLASRDALNEQLNRRHREDGEARVPYLGVLGKTRRRRAAVVMDGTRVGVLQETVNGTRFEYDPAYLARPNAIAISPTLPLEGVSFATPGLLPFFANLLPEGSRLTWASQRQGLDPNDRFGVLLATGRNTIGAVEVHAVPEET